MSHLTSTQTLECHPLPLHRPWNVTPTRPPHSQLPFQPTALFNSPTTPATNDNTTPETQPNQRRASFSSTRLLQPTSTLFVDLDNKFQQIPAQHRISDSTLVAEFNSSSGPGNFAKHLTEKLFPEFFTEECLHRFYSCNANGDKKNNKNQLDPSCIQPLKEYVRHFFPEVTQPQAWKLMVIPKINDALRRPKPLQKTQM